MKGGELVNYVLIFIAIFSEEVVFSLTNIMTYKKKRVIASLLRFIGKVIFFVVITNILQENSLYVVLTASIASAIGRYASFSIDKLMTKDSSFLIMMTYNGDKKDLQHSIDKLRKMCYDVFSYYTYHQDGVSSLSLKVVTKTRKESRVVKSVMPDGVKFNVIELKEYY